MSAASLYLTALISAQLLDVNASDDRRLVVDVATKYYEESLTSAGSSNGSDSDEVVDYAAGDVFRWLIGNDIIRNRGSGGAQSAEPEVIDVVPSEIDLPEYFDDGDDDVCMISLSDEGNHGDLLQSVRELLQKHLGLYVIEVDRNTPMGDIKEAVAHSKSVLTVEASYRSRDIKQLKLDVLQKLPVGVAVILGGGSDDELVYCRNWLCVSICGTDSRIAMTHRLLNVVANWSYNP